MEITKEYIDKLIEKAGLENVVTVFHSAIEICTPVIYKSYSTPLPNEEAGYEVLATIIQADRKER